MENGLQGGGKIRRYSRSIIILIAVLLFFSGAEASHLSGGTGARPLSMGNAFVGLADDGSALFLNPAGLAGIKYLNLISMYTQPASQTVFGSLGAAAPGFLGGVAGIGYRNRTVSNIPTSNETVSYTDQEILFAFARMLRSDLSLGGDIRFISCGTSKDIPGLENLNGSGNALDLSLKYFFRPWMTLGLSLQNLVGEVTYRDGLVERIEENIFAGTSFRIMGKEALIKKPDQEMLVNLDASQTLGEPVLLHLGFEWWPIKLLALRAGIDQTPKSTTDTYANVTAGLGLKYRGVTFDYAWYKLGDPSGSISNYVSLGYVGPEEIKAAPAAVPVYLTPESVAVKKIKRVRFTDLQQNYWAREKIELLATAGLIWGYPDGTFKPKRKVTRGDFEILVALAKHTTAVSVLNPDRFITRAEAAKKIGIERKIDRSGDPLTRAEAASFFFETAFGEAAIKRLPPLED